MGHIDVTGYARAEQRFRICSDFEAKEGDAHFGNDDSPSPDVPGVPRFRTRSLVRATSGRSKTETG